MLLFDAKTKTWLVGHFYLRIKFLTKVLPALADSLFEIKLERLETFGAEEMEMVFDPLELLPDMLEYNQQNLNEKTGKIKERKSGPNEVIGL